MSVAKAIANSLSPAMSASLLPDYRFTVGQYRRMMESGVYCLD